MDSEEVVFILILPLAVILAGVVVLIAAMRHRAKTLELVHKERVAMIERGIVPPEVGPGGYDTRHFPQASGTRSRSFSLGIIVVGIGFAFMTLIGIAAQAPNEAVGIGGAIVILGAAFIVRSLLTAQANEPTPRMPAHQPPAPQGIARSETWPRSEFPPSSDVPPPPSEPLNR
ncbi:MAG: hypothetical protein IT177_25545 [Acidobacteria bacterium]|nr:hypothetical protein [Acidobacteriota bacterium]